MSFGALAPALSIWLALGASLVSVVLGLWPAGHSLASPPEKTLHVLFIGNSFTARHDLPRLVKTMAEAGQLGLQVEVESVIYGGRTLEDHWQLRSQHFVSQVTLTREGEEAAIRELAEKAKAGNDKFAALAAARHRELLRSLDQGTRRRWDIVVLQSYRDDLPDDPRYGQYAEKFAALVHAQGGRVVLYETTPTTQNQKPLAAAPDPAPVLAKEKVIAGLAKKIGATAVPMALVAFHCQTVRPDLTLRFVNDPHLNQTMAYLTACTFYGAVFGRSPQGLPLDRVTDTRFRDNDHRDQDLDGGPITREFSAADRADLQRIAWEGLEKFHQLADAAVPAWAQPDQPHPNEVMKVPADGIGNGLLSLQFDPRTGLAEVQTAGGKRYRQIAPPRWMKGIGDVAVERLSDLEATVALAYKNHRFVQRYRLAPDAPCLRVTVTGPEDFVIRTKADGPPLPVFFSQPGAGYEWAVTDGLGMLLKADAPEMPVDEATGAAASTVEFAVYSGFGLRQAWMGLTHPVHGDGWGVIFEDPWSVVAVLTAGTEDGQPHLSGHARINGYLGRFKQSRSVQFFFVESGGYRQLAKTYRRFVEQQGRFRSFEAKIAKSAEVAKLQGAADVWVFRRPRNAKVNGEVMRALADFHAAGLERAIVHVGDIEMPFPPDNVAALKDMGFLVGHYDNYTDVEPDHPDPGHRARIDDAAVGPAGAAQKRGDDLDGTERLKMSPAAIMPWAEKVIGPDIAANGWTARLIDVLGGAALFSYEDFAPHRPVDAQQGYEYRRALFEDLFERGQVVGTEQGCDWVTPFIHYAEGGLGHRRWLEKSQATQDGRPLRVGWEAITPGENYRRFSMNPANRVPLDPLVYADSQLNTYHWSDGNLRIPEFARRKDLLCILNGMPPTYVFTPEYYFAHRDEFVDSARRVLPAIAKVFGVEMTDHRWLTADRMVQQTTWANGVRITVNFGKEPFPGADGMVAGEDFLLQAP